MVLRTRKISRRSVWWKLMFPAGCGISGSKERSRERGAGDLHLKAIKSSIQTLRDMRVGMLFLLTLCLPEYKELQKLLITGLKYIITMAREKAMARSILG